MLRLTGGQAGSPVARTVLEGRAGVGARPDLAAAEVRGAEVGGLEVLAGGLRVVQQGGGGPGDVSIFGVLSHGGRDRNVIFQAETDIVQRPMSAGSKLRLVKTVSLPGQHLILQIIVVPRLLEQILSEGRFEHCLLS